MKRAFYFVHGDRIYRATRDDFKRLRHSVSFVAGLLRGVA